MEIRRMAELYALYPQAQEVIRYDSPELLLMKHISENDTEAALALFREKRQFSDAPPAVDTPYGRFEGKQQIRDFAALRPFWASEGETTDVLWPAFTAHRDWWRFLLFVHYQSYAQDGYQFEIMPVWWNGRREGKPEEEDRGYAGLFPLYGSHPHFLLLYDWQFCLWPVWMRYSMPRPPERPPTPRRRAYRRRAGPGSVCR